MGAIRLILALSVTVWHVGGDAPFRMLNAGVAVLLFFVISGFYMALVINEKYARGDEPWLATFYRARVLRLGPTYLAFLLIIIAWSTWTGSPNAFTQSPPEYVWWQRAGLVALNLFVAGQDLFQLVIMATQQHNGAEYVAGIRDALSPSYFDGSMMLIGQAWSLSSEIFFYALAPFIVRSPLRIIALLAASLAVRWLLVGYLGLFSGIWGYWFFPATLCFFLMGALAYHLHRIVAPYPQSITIGWVALGFMAVWFVLLIAANGIILPDGPAWSMDLPRFWCAYIAFAAGVPFIFSATKWFKADRFIGELSYPLYLSHGLVLGICFIVLGYDRSTMTGFALAIGSSLAAAVLLRVCVEWPTESWERRSPPSRRVRFAPIVLQKSEIAR
jgi:peptidoglycan/LPS O-acetylase OafA/YrhL